MKLNAKSALVSGAIFAVVAIIYGLYRLARALHAGMQLLNNCKDYECDKCPTEGLCGLSKDEK